MNKTYESYEDIQLTSEVMESSSHRLIQLLINRCLQHIRIAKQSIIEKNFDKKFQSISSAREIIEHLNSSLNFKDEKAQEIASLLQIVYNFIEKSLLQAAWKNDTEYLDEAEKVLSTIKSGWDGIGDSNNK